MKTLKVLYPILYVVLLVISGCSNEDQGQKELLLTVDHEYLLANGLSSIQLTASKGKNKVLASGEVEFFVNGMALSTDRFNTDIPGEYVLEARRGNSTSNQITVNAREPKSYEKVELPIIFHIVHDGSGVGTGDNFSQGAVNTLMDELNPRFNNNQVMAGITNPNKVVPRIFFRMAETDPEGNILPEPGINRVRFPSSSATVQFESWMFDIYWDPNRYINVWVGRTNGNFSFGVAPVFPAGITPLPGTSTDANTMPVSLNGIVLSPDVIRNVWTGTFSHEIGHYLSLFHVFDKGCGREDSDFCPDTKFYLNENNSTFPTTKDRVSCEGQPYISNNFMDYSDSFLNTFTFDQVERMRYTLDRSKWRAGLAKRVID